MATDDQESSPEQEARQAASDAKKTVGAVKTTVTTTRTAVKTAKAVAQAAKVAKTGLQIAATAAEATNPVGWAMLAAQYLPKIKKAIGKLIRKVAKIGAVTSAAFLLVLGAKIVGALGGLAFGAVTGVPLLAVPGIGPFLYTGWTAGWGVYGWFNPAGVQSAITNTLTFAKSVGAYIKSSATASVAPQIAGAKLLGSAVSGIGNFVTGLAQTAWSGLAGSLGGFLSGTGSFLLSLTGLSAPVAAAAIPVFSAIGAVTIGSVVVGIVTDVTFSARTGDPASGGEGIPPPPSSQYVSVEKLVSDSALSLGPSSSIHLENSNLPQLLTFIVNVKAITDLSDITCSDVITLTKNDGSTEELSLPITLSCPSSLTAGETFSFAFNLNVPNDTKYYDSTISNKFSLSGNGVKAAGANYWIPIRDPVLNSSALDAVKAKALTSYPNNLINAPCPGGLTCWDYVISQSQAKGINPTFVLAIWYEESHFSDTGNHFSCPASIPRTHDGDGLAASLSCFLDTIVNGEPNTSDGFIDFANHYCGTGPWSPDPINPLPICKNNPNFLSQLKAAYEELGGTVNPLVGAGSPDPFSTDVIAAARIGTLMAGCPSGWPITGAVSQGPEGATSHLPLGLEALDIAANIGNQVYSTIDGTVSESFVNGGDPFDQRIGVTPTNCPGLEIVYYWHLSARYVNVGDLITPKQPIGQSGSAGTGPHIHYQFNRSFNRSFPINAPPYIPQFVTRTCDSIPGCNVITSAP